MARPLLLLSLLFSWWTLPACADGAWFKTPPNGPLAPFTPDFFLLKTAAFSNGGKLKTYLGSAELKKACAAGKDVVAWVSHLLSPGEVMSPESAKRLAGELNTLLSPVPCAKGVELDVEPLEDLPPWFTLFCQTVRTHLDKRFVLTAAIPALWREPSALLLLSVVDGLDFMIYDTGAKTVDEYAPTLKAAVNFAGLTEKTILLGLPAYPDKTKKHRPGVENIKAVTKTLEGLPQASTALCRPNLRFAYYAGWTMTDAEKREAAEFQRWRRSLCVR